MYFYITKIILSPHQFWAGLWLGALKIFYSWGCYNVSASKIYLIKDLKKI